MNFKTALAVCAAACALILLAGCGGGSGGGSGGTGCLDAPVVDPVVPSNVQIPDSTRPAVGRAHTNHLILTSNGRAVFAGYTPDQIRTAYGIPAGGGSAIVTVVDGFDNPNALTDFNAFSAAFGLPQETSSDVTASTNQHLQIVYATGAKPTFNSGWSQESDLDIEWVHAMAPNAKIVLVEALSGNTSDLIAAVDVAAAIPNAHQCSNSWNAPETSFEKSNDSHFTHPGVVFYFASGDAGGTVTYPPASPFVVSVGGTTLTLDGSDHRLSETAWSGSGCGKSNCEARPMFQDAIAAITGATRGTADVAAVADPLTGVRVRWQGKWMVFGGTSVACPIIAGIANDAGTNRNTSQEENAFIYSTLGTSSFFDVTSGKAGSLNAAVGWDFPTGIGTPNGIGGF